MIRRLSIVSLFVATAAASAQQVAVQPVPVTPMSSVAVLGSLVDLDSSNQVPAMMISLASDGAGNQAGAVSTYGLQESVGVRRLSIEQSLLITNPSGQPAFAAASMDLRFDISATAPTNVQVELVVQFIGSPGAPLPTVTIDVGDDGSVEHQGVGPGLPLPFVSAGPVAFPVRVKTATQLAGSGHSTLSLDLTVRPAQPPLVTPQVSGCADDKVGGNLVAVPDFDGGLVFAIAPAPWFTPVLVLGLGVQPILLPSVLSPCLLLPSTDILLPFPFAPSGYPSLDLELPAAVRPVTFWAQAVIVDPIGLFPTDAFRVDAL